MPSKIEAADWHDIFALPDAGRQKNAALQGPALRAARTNAPQLKPHGGVVFISVIKVWSQVQ
jgi:hypothetical protein